MNEGMEKGLQQGRQAGVASLTIRQLNHRFGELDASTQAPRRGLSSTYSSLELIDRVVSAILLG